MTKCALPEDRINLQSPSYTPGKLLNAAAFLLGVTSDRALSRELECNEALICRVRNRKQVVSHYLMCQIMDRTGWHIREVRELAGMPFDGPAKLVVPAQRLGLRLPSQRAAA